MEYGWAESAPGRLRSRLPNLNLLPAELLPVPIPWLTGGLVLLATGLVMLLYALFYMRSYTDLEIAAYRARLASAQEQARQLGLPVEGEGQAALPPGVLEDWAELKARQVNWPGLLNAITGAAPAVNVTGATQTGYTVSIAGDAATTADANTFLQKLRESGLFASLEMSITGASEEPAAQPTAPPTTQPIATPPPAPTFPAAPPASSNPPPFSPPLPTIPPAPTRAPTTPPQPTATLAPRTPLATPTPLGTPPTVQPSAVPGTPTVVATNTPAFDFAVQSKRETVDPNAIGSNSSIRIRVIDAAGNLVPGLSARIESQGQPPWSADLPRSGGAPSNGTFEFPVGMGKFTVFVNNGYSERATDLFTGVQGQPGVHVWDVTFRKMTPGTPPAGPTCPTCTATPTPPPTPTPISYGPNVASQSCVSASSNQGDAYKIVDGNYSTGWDPGALPINQVNVDFSCRTPSSHVVDAVELIAQMSARSKVTVELWALYADGTAALVNTFTDVDAYDGLTMSYKFPTPRQVSTFAVRTLRSNVNLGWREIRIYEPLGPALGTPTPLATSTPFATSVVATPTSPPVAAQSLTASSSSPGNPPDQAADGSLATFWRPLSTDSAPQLIYNIAAPQPVTTVRFTSSFGDNGTTTPTPTVAGGATAVQATYEILLVQSAAQAVRSGSARAPQAEVSCGRHVITSDNQTIQDTCPSTASSFQVIVRISNLQGGVQPGVREMSVYGSASTPTSTPTPPPGSTGTPSTTTTTTATLTATATPTPSVTPTPIASPPPGKDIAAGRLLQAASADGASPENAVDVDGGVQNRTTWWQADAAPGVVGQKKWTFTTLAGTPVSAVQARIYMATPSSGWITFKFLTAANATVVSDYSTPVSADDQLVGPYYSTPLTVDHVSIVFTQLATVPGLRTVGIYTPATGDRRSAMWGVSTRFPSSIASLLSIFDPPRAHAERLSQPYPVPDQPTQLPPTPAASASGSYPAPAPPRLFTPTPLPPGHGPFAQSASPPANQSQPAAAPPQAPPPQPAATQQPMPTVVPGGRAAQQQTPPLTGNPFPGAPLVPAPRAAPSTNPLAPAPAPRGRVSFLIVAQVRPGAP